MKNVHEMVAGDVVIWFGGAISLVLDNEEIGHGKMRITLSAIASDRISTLDVPRGWLFRVNA